jgi:hypothetical protein
MEKNVDLKRQIKELERELYDSILFKDELWLYHPKNPNYINVISVFKKLEDEIELIERKINDLTFKLNALN